MHQCYMLTNLSQRDKPPLAEFAKGGSGMPGKPDGPAIVSFLADVFALAGDEPDDVREGVRVALAKCFGAWS
jgi:hypothetical protein